MHGESIGNYAYGMWPILMFAYYKLSMREEKDVQEQFGEGYRAYKNRVPAFLPAGRRVFQKFSMRR